MAPGTSVSSGCPCHLIRAWRGPASGYRDRNLLDQAGEAFELDTNYRDDIVKAVIEVTSPIGRTTSQGKGIQVSTRFLSS